MFEQKKRPQGNPFGGNDKDEKEDEFKIIGEAPKKVVKKESAVKEMIKMAREKKASLKPRSICGC